MENTLIDYKKEIDEKQIFEKDDDVGGVFSDLYLIIKKLNQRTNSNVQDKETN